MAPAPASAPAPAVAALPLGAIQLLSGGNAGKEMELTKTLTTLGKPGVQVAVIARRPHGYFITHVEIFVNAQGGLTTRQAVLPRSVASGYSGKAIFCSVLN